MSHSLNGSDWKRSWCNQVSAARRSDKKMFMYMHQEGVIAHQRMRKKSKKIKSLEKIPSQLHSNLSETQSFCWRTRYVAHECQSQDLQTSLHPQWHCEYMLSHAGMLACSHTWEWCSFIAFSNSHFYACSFKRATAKSCNNGPPTPPGSHIHALQPIHCSGQIQGLDQYSSDQAVHNCKICLQCLTILLHLLTSHTFPTPVHNVPLHHSGFVPLSDKPWCSALKRSCTRIRGWQKGPFFSTLC